MSFLCFIGNCDGFGLSVFSTIASNLIDWVTIAVAQRGPQLVDVENYDRSEVKKDVTHN